MEPVNNEIFEHSVNSIEEVKALLKKNGVQQALVKKLPKNANDKNQVYINSSLQPLHPLFSLKFDERVASTSTTKRKSAPGKKIPEAIFTDFRWLKPDGRLVRAKNLKAIIYAQYPEVRLSGFQTVENTMPESLSIEFTKKDNSPLRLLVMGQLPGGAAIGLIILDPSQNLLTEVENLPSLNGSRVCKKLIVARTGTEKLEALLKTTVGKRLDGCRFDKDGNTIPFKGTQVCGYTLEHACGITPNSNKGGDIFGIELKAHTQNKVTLFTPEPDFGAYKDSFDDFMIKYGYAKGDVYRLTGIHRANIRCTKSGLTLKVRVMKEDKATNTWIYTEYDPTINLTSVMNTIDVVLLDDNQNVAAGWSFERLMNCWGSKHNEVVYVPAKKYTHTNDTKRLLGFEYEVEFQQEVMWCETTSAQHLFNAIHSGEVYLDPAPKLDTKDPSNNKRRSQWRLNNIHKSAHHLYEKVEFKRLLEN